MKTFLWPMTHAKSNFMASVEAMNFMERKFSWPIKWLMGHELRMKYTTVNFMAWSINFTRREFHGL